MLGLMQSQPLLISTLLEFADRHHGDGEIVSRRHALWRVFDFAWMLHIMDYEARTNVNNPLLRIATLSAAAMALSAKTAKCTPRFQ
mgnify:CR=1 FL=1